MTRCGFHGDFDDFRSLLLATESGIDPDLHDWYLEHFDTPTLRMPAVSKPGRILRDPESGLPEMTKVTVREYFAMLGVDEWAWQEDRSTLQRMQYASINALGFVGYQFGEALLTTLGVYEPQQVLVAGAGRCPRMYCGDVPHERWRHGVTEHVYVNPWSGLTTLATDVNLWNGRFTGRCGVANWADLRSPGAQEQLLALVLRMNSQEILRMLGFPHDVTGREDACRLLTASHTLKTAESSLASSYAYSGFLAAAHLCGHNAVHQFLKTGRDAADEYLTTMSAYIEKFAGFDLSSLLDHTASSLNLAPEG